jgi:tRNA modification GTPase
MRMLSDDAGFPQSGFCSFRATLRTRQGVLPANVYLMRKPASYTREDVVEFHIFGNPALHKSLLEELQALGARPAAPGEFTRRAFLNGRLDLAQAEAVEALIHAQDEAEYRAAQEVLGGRPSRRLHALREELLELSALVEVSLDFSDQDVEIISHADAMKRLLAIREGLRQFSEAADSGRVRRAAVRVAFFGPPNAGKSSLFNALLAKRRAIVSPHPGTTRDTIEAVLALEGTEITLIDTAGMRPPMDKIEAAAIERSYGAVLRADLGLCVIDASAPPSGEARDAVKALPPGRTMILLNKSDVAFSAQPIHDILPPGVETIEVSAFTGHGISRLVSRIRERIEGGMMDRRAGDIMVSARQTHLIRRAGEALDRALDEDRERLMDLLAGDLSDALGALTDLTGDDANEDVLDRIFSSFCIGK